MNTHLSADDLSPGALAGGLVAACLVGGLACWGAIRWANTEPPKARAAVAKPRPANKAATKPQPVEVVEEAPRRTSRQRIVYVDPSGVRRSEAPIMTYIDSSAPVPQQRAAPVVRAASAPKTAYDWVMEWGGQIQHATTMADLDDVHSDVALLYRAARLSRQEQENRGDWMRPGGIDEIMRMANNQAIAGALLEAIRFREKVILYPGHPYRRMFEHSSDMNIEQALGLVRNPLPRNTTETVTKADAERINAHLARDIEPPGYRSTPNFSAGRVAVGANRESGDTLPGNTGTDPLAPAKPEPRMSHGP